MFRRARLSVKPNVRPSVGARGSGAAAPQRGPEPARPPEPAAPAAPPPAEPAEEAPADFGGAEPQEQAPRSSDEKTDGENDVVEESSKSSSIVSQRRKRVSSTSSVVKPNVSVPSESQPLSTVNSEAPTPSPVPTAEKQPCSDRYRIYKAQKLREMLKEELRKEKKQWKNKYATSESQRPPDRSKMTMRDFIYYLPDNNPMTSSLEQEKRTEKSLTTVQSKEQESKNPPDTEDNEDIEEEADDGPLLVPRVKVAEDGSIILDEESLTVEVLRTKGPCVVEENDPIFERGSTTTYSSFRKNYYSKPWSNKETDMFFLAISMVGTDFSMIGQLFPHRARIEIKNKFKREEKTNGWRIDKAFQEKRPFDFDFFAHLLQKVLAEEEKRKQKSVKSQPLREKKSSKPQKNVKAKKVTSEGVSDDPDESVGTKVSDTEGLQKDAQTIEEQSSASSEQDLEQGTSESDLNQNKRRKKNRDESGKQAVKNQLENTTAQPVPSEEEKQDDKCQPLRPEISEDDGNKEHVLFCNQNSEDIDFSTEKAEKRTDPILSSSQQDATSVRGETLESCAVDSPPPDIDVGALCALSLAEGSSTEKRTVDVESKTLEADQVENVKPKVRGRLQRPKPNLSRAVGKKPVLTQSKTLAESKSLHPETSVEKSNMEKDEVNTADISVMENTTEVKDADAEAVSNSSEKICPQEDDEPKVFRPARLLRGRLQRPKPNISKAAERKETPASQDKNGANVEKSEIQSCADRNTPEQVDDKSCKNFECENVVSQPEKNDSSQNIQLDDHAAPNECLSSIQEDSTSNIFKQVPILKTRFQKPKPNIGRGTRKREMFSKEEVAEEILASEKMTAALREIARLEISPREEVPVEVDNTQEINSCLKESGRRDISPKEKIAETVDTTEEMETDLKETGMEISSSQTVAEVTEVIEEEELGFKETEVEISPSESVPEMTEINEEKESRLKETGVEISPSKTISEMTDVIEEKESDLKEIVEEITPYQRIAEMIEITEEEKSDLKETGEEITPCQRIAEMIEITEEKESDLKETGEEITPCQRIAEMIEITEEKESDLKETGEEITPCQRIAEMIEITEEKESDLKETGKEITPCQRIAEEITEEKESELKETTPEIREEITPCQRIAEEITEEKESDLKETGEETTPCQRIAEMIEITEEKESGLKETGEETTPCQRIAEMIEITEEKESDLKETGEEITPYQRIEMIGITEEKELDLKETGEMITPYQTIEMVEITEENESDLEETGDEIIPYQRIAEMIEFSEERETDMKEIEEITPFQIAEMIEITEERETDMKEIEEITPCQRIAEEIEITEERETNLDETKRKEIPPNEGVSNEVNTIGEVETDLRGTEKEISLTERPLVGISAIGEREVFMKETGKGDMSLMEKIPGKGTGTAERKADLKETQEDIFFMKSRSEETGAAEEMVADLKPVRPVDVSLRENKTEETGTLRQTERDLTQDSCDRSASPSLNASNISSELLPMVQTSVEVKTSSEMEMSSSVHSLQILDYSIIEDQGMHSTDIQEQFSDVNISTSLPEEQKPAEVKPAPFVRSRFKRPKPNLARAALKRETLAAKTPVPGKKLETARTEGVVLAQSTVLSEQQDVAPLTTSGEKDESCPREGADGALPGMHPERDLVPTSSGGSKEEAESAPTWEEDVAVSLGTQSTNSLQQEIKENTTQSAVPVRGRLQRPRPNLRKAGQRQVAAGVEARGGTLEDRRTTLQKEEAEKKLLDAANSQLGIEIEVVSSKISECRMNDILDEQKSHEHKAHVPSPAPLVRRQFQKVKPNLGRAHGKREERCPGKGRAGQSQAREPVENWLQQGNSDTQLLEKDKFELQTSHEISARKDGVVGSTEPGLTRKGAQSEVRPSASIGERTVGDNPVSSIIKEQHLNKPPSCPQLLKESSYSKTALDRRTASSSISEREIDQSERRMHRKIKSNAARGRGSKRVRSKAPKKEPRTSKAMLVTLRASQEEEDDDVDDLDLDYEEESYHLAPEEVNKAPVFVPIGLRSPEPVTAQIEETMEELEITMDVPDVGCITVVEQELLNVEVNPQEVKQDVSENMLTVEITTSEHTQNEAGPSDGNAEAAVALLTVGDVLLQSQISVEQGQVGICVLPDVQSRDKNHIPFSPDHVNHSIVHECQDLSSPVTTTSSSSLKENKIVLDGQSTTEKIELMEEAKEETLSNRNTASEVTNNLKMRSRFAKPKVNLTKILGTNSVGAHPNLSGTKGEEEEIHRETEKSASDTAELEENLEAVTAAESWEQSRLADVIGVQGSLEHGNLTERNEDQEVEHQQAQILSVAPVVSSDPSCSPLTLGLSEALSESPTDAPPAQGSEGCSVLTLHVPECISTSIPEIQEENVIGSQDLTVNVIAADVQQDNEDEHTFILTLVEIPANEVEEFADTTTQLMPNPLLPAPILLKSVNNEETGDMSMNFPVTPISQDAMCLSDSGGESEKPPANLDVSRKRFHCSLDESDSVPPAKKSSFASVDNCEKYSSEVCSKELVNVFEETGASHKEQNNVPTSGSIPTTPKSQKRQLEPSTLQSIGSRSLDKITDRQLEKTPPLLPQDKMVVSDKEERTCSASKSEQMHNRPSSSKTSLSRPGRRPLGFLSLICSKSSLESDEPTQFHKKKRPKPLIPVARQNLKRSNPPSESQKTNPESSDVLPSSSGASTASENLNSPAAASQVSCDHPLLEEKCKSGPNQAPGEEPTTVSEYFFGDIFIEVDET
ncbi:transcription factor TFIIIB component B'' homolog isoform X3 [Sorex araneus]|uniref:transcription factor TFIIIB component B'' homolog isoform X3 n=1 Tax=Sorex araneus TaxID=42254 RepID=UPI0024338798|nr:transcription factor TFIIIB component B'' homolog isoform X3 [Sorex araneus]